jgi:serine/threonine protein phosphatase PrpC
MGRRSGAPVRRKGGAVVPVPEEHEPEVLAPGAARLFTEEDMAAAACFEVAGGQAVVYSARCPGAERANQDTAGVFSLDPGRAVLAVADGLGGHSGGASASRLALQALEGSLEGSNAEEAPVRGGILDGIESANRAVLELGIGAGTTLAAVEILLGTLRPYHVGDSEIVVVGQRGKVKLQTIAHSPVGYAIEAGLLDPEEALHHDERHLVSNLVGSSEMRIEVGSPLSLASRDTVLLATDGLLDNLSLDEIVDAMRTGPIADAAEKLAALGTVRMQSPRAGQPSKPDDTTFILFRPTS